MSWWLLVPHVSVALANAGPRDSQPPSSVIFGEDVRGVFPDNVAVPLVRVGLYIGGNRGGAQAVYPHFPGFLGVGGRCSLPSPTRAYDPSPALPHPPLHA